MQADVIITTIEKAKLSPTFMLDKPFLFILLKSLPCASKADTQVSCVSYYRLSLDNCFVGDDLVSHQLGV